MVAGNSEATAKCIRETSNWSFLEMQHKFDKPEYSAKKVLRDMPSAAPKLHALLQKIKELDTQDEKEHGKLFKHFIYSDIKSSYGAKLIASALKASGMNHAYALKRGQRGMTFKIDTQNIAENKSNTFATLTSTPFFEKPIGINFKKELLGLFNSRPDNIQGEKVRVIILDSGFREGVDLFDIKYVHLFEPILTRADEKQAIGRATRFCGQKGLNFHPQEGWPIHVFKYETIIPKDIKQILHEQLPSIAPSTNFLEMFLKYSNLDPRKLNFANELERVAIMSAMDRELTKQIHEFRVVKKLEAEAAAAQLGGAQSGSKFLQVQNHVAEHFSQYTWPKIKIENGCVGGAQSNVLPFTPTQNFIRSYFTPKSENQGMLLWHSVGTGKTCTAVATASTTFEREGYTIIFVTRHTLKADIYKNVFDQTCSDILQERIRDGKEIPENNAQRMRLTPKWMQPMSYKQFSNMLAGKSQLSKELISRNGRADPLHKTLVIIDEAHKLFAPDVAGSEKPDLEKIRSSFANSFNKSGKDGVRILFMTATPYTDDPMDLIRLMNIFRPPSAQMPETFETFAEEYLAEDGKFSDTDRMLKFMDDIAGQISYLNREKDLRTFSYPVVTHVNVKMSDYEFEDALSKMVSDKEKLNDRVHSLEQNKSYIHQDIEVKRSRRLQEIYNEAKTYDTQFKNCVKAKSNTEASLQKEINDAYKAEIIQCKKVRNTCIDRVKSQHAELVSELRKTASTAKKECTSSECKVKVKEDMEKQIAALKLDREFDVETCEENTKVAMQRCTEAAKQKQVKALDDLKKIKVAQEQGNDPCAKIKEDKKAFIDQQKLISNRYLERVKEQDLRELQVDEVMINEMRTKFKIDEASVMQSIEKDKSQRRRLESCLGLEPAFKQILQGKYKFIKSEDDDDLMNALNDDLEEQGVFNNIFLVCGHGSEKVEKFAKRVTMPDDKVLVVFPMCARPNFMDSGCDFAKMFNDPTIKTLFKDPLKNQKKLERLLGRPMRMYLPGEKVPNLSTNLFFNFEKDKTVIMKSGVFKLNKIPEIDREVFPVEELPQYSLGSSNCYPFVGLIKNGMYYNSAIHKQVYKGNVFRPANERSSYDRMIARSYKLQTIMDEVGPGVYFYIGCRSSDDMPAPDAYMELVRQSDSQQVKKHRSERMRQLKQKLKETGKAGDGDYDDDLEKDGEATPNPTTPENKKEKEDKKEKKKIIKNTDGEIEELEKIRKAALDTIDFMFVSPQNSNSNSKSKRAQTFLSDSKAIMLPIPQSALWKKVEFDLDVVEYLLSSIGEGTPHFSSEKTIQEVDGTTHEIHAIVSTMVYKIKKKRVSLNRKRFGVVLDGLRDESEKCSSRVLVKYILNILNNGGEIQLPKTVGPWLRNTTIFDNICRRVRELA